MIGLISVVTPNFALAQSSTTGLTQVPSKRAIRGTPPLFAARPDPDTPGRFWNFTANGCAVSFAVEFVLGLTWSGQCIDGRAQGNGELMVYDDESQPISHYRGTIERARRTNGESHEVKRDPRGQLAGEQTRMVGRVPQPGTAVAFLDMPRPFLLAMDDWQRQINGRNTLAEMGAAWAPGYQEEQRKQSASQMAGGGAAPAGERGASPGAGSSAGSSSVSACSEDIMRVQIESQRWPGNSNDVAAKLGQFQKSLFQGRCAGHPEASAYIASANRMIGYGGNPAGAGGGPLPALASSPNATAAHDSSRTRKVHNPAADAKPCTVITGNGKLPALSTRGGWQVANNCGVPIEAFWCVVSPNGQCRNGGTWSIRPGGTWSIQEEGQALRWAACKGRNSGGFDRDSNGEKYTCHLLEW